MQGDCDRHGTGIADEGPGAPGRVREERHRQGDGPVGDRSRSGAGIARPAPSALLNGRASLSPEMALRIEKVFGMSVDTLLRMQTSHDIARTREDEINLVPVEARVS